MKHLPLQLLAAISSCFALVKAQWVLDNRCGRRRDLGRTNNALSGRSDLTTGSSVKISKSSNSSSDESQRYWYSGLRGHLIATRAPASKNFRGGRDLVVEDPSAFMMRLHWQEGNCWQGEMISRSFCMACENGDECVGGNKLWTQFCDNSPGQKFVWVPNLSQKYSKDGTSVNYGQLKMAYFNLCLERMTTNTYLLQQCDTNSAYQVLAGWHPTKSFELHPIENTGKCINQHHHPRPEEEIANTACDTARHFHTNRWKVYRNENATTELLRLRRPECSRDAPCAKCQGDCDSSEQCSGDLICVQRNADQLPVPGCTGIPIVNADYCASPKDLFVPPVPNHGLRMRQAPCTAGNPCAHCVGDCDSDDACIGSMKCFMRGNSNPHEKVPNCVGEGVPEADYCYEANEALTLEAPVELETRVVECGRRGKVCMQCQGDCDYDEDCYGKMKCFQRRQGNPPVDVPGCEGKADGEVDYCYLPEGISFPTQPPIDDEYEAIERDQVLALQQGGHYNAEDQSRLESSSTSMPLDHEIRKCSESKQCSLCQGDCDTDTDCAGTLICFQRLWHEANKAVPRCTGRGVHGGDYCIEP